MQESCSYFEQIFLLTVPEVDILARTVPASDNGQPCESRTPINTLPWLLNFVLGHQGRHGRQVVQDYDSHFEQTILLVPSRRRDFAQIVSVSGNRRPCEPCTPNYVIAKL